MLAGRTGSSHPQERPWQRRELSMYARIISRDRFGRQPAFRDSPDPSSAGSAIRPSVARRDTPKPMFAGGRSGSDQYLPGGGQRARPAGLGFGDDSASNLDHGWPQHDLRDPAVTTAAGVRSWRGGTLGLTDRLNGSRSRGPRRSSSSSTTKLLRAPPASGLRCSRPHTRRAERSGRRAHHPRGRAVLERGSW